MQDYTPITQKLFKEGYQLIDGTDEIFELDLALWEYETLTEKELICRSGYFKTINYKETNHYKLCNLQNLEEIHKNSSFKTKIFFLEGKYSTGYATHSLFPYRGKFHPQLIRGLLNILQIKQGDIVLDPMAGSATVSVEASLLGIDSVAVDFSPFCELMGKVKTFSLNLDVDQLKSIVRNPKEILKNLKKEKVPEYFSENTKDRNRNYYEIILLAYLDSMGFANRSNYPLENLFPRVLERYISTITYFNQARRNLKLKIGNSRIVRGNALELDMKDDSVDAVITSPPYSFAIDYIKNDLPQLKYLGYNPEVLRKNMIGLQGRGVDNKLEIYFNEMKQALSEMKRVSKNSSPIVIIIGTNEIQTNGIRLEDEIIKISKKINLEFELNLKKPIKGLQNTMKEESILFFKNRK